MTRLPNGWRSDIEAEVDAMFADLHNIPDAVRDSALQSSEIMQKNRELENSGIREKQADEQQRVDRNALTRRANLVGKFYEPERKMALFKLKAMNVGDVLVVSMLDANNLRVACNYHQNYHDKKFYTARFEYNKRAYIEIKRVE
jgi:hypothetical protein